MGASIGPSHQRQKVHLKRHLWAAVSQWHLLRVIVLQFCILWLSSLLCMPSSHLRTSVSPRPTRHPLQLSPNLNTQGCRMLLKLPPSHPAQEMLDYHPLCQRGRGVLGTPSQAGLCTSGTSLPFSCSWLLPLALTWFLRTACPAPLADSPSQSQPSRSPMPSSVHLSPHSLSSGGSEGGLSQASDLNSTLASTTD